MKFGQLIEYNMINIFLEKSYTKCGGETSLRPFSGKLKLRISLDQLSKDLYSLFLLILSSGLSKYIETKLQSGCFYLILSIFNKKRDLELVSLPHFLHNFWRKIFLFIFLYCLVVLTFWDIGQYVYCSYLLTRLWRHEFCN